MQSVSSRIWTRVTVSTSYDDNDYTTSLKIFGQRLERGHKVSVRHKYDNTNKSYLQQKIKIKEQIQKSVFRLTNMAKESFWYKSLKTFRG